MVSYPYQGKDLFQAPEKYHYAPCADARFLEQWTTYIKETCSGLPAPSPPVADPAGAPEGLRYRLAHLLENPTPADLLPLVHRFEVFRRLWSAYQPNQRKTDDATPAELDEYILFAHVLLRHFRADQNFQWMSTLLKLVDAIASRRSDIPDDSASVFHQLLIELLEQIRSVS